MENLPIRTGEESKLLSSNRFAAIVPFAHRLIKDVDENG